MVRVHTHLFKLCSTCRTLVERHVSMTEKVSVWTMKTLVLHPTLFAHIITQSEHDAESEALLWLENDVAIHLRYQNGDSDLGDFSAIPIRCRYSQICYACGLVVSNVSVMSVQPFCVHLKGIAMFTLAQKSVLVP